VKLFVDGEDLFVDDGENMFVDGEKFHVCSVGGGIIFFGDGGDMFCCSGVKSCSSMGKNFTCVRIEVEISVCRSVDGSFESFFSRNRRSL